MQDHPLRACYPYGGHDIAVELAPEETANPLIGRLLKDLVTALFTADPRCRRVVAAPAEDDAAAQDAFETGGFRRVTEADLPTGTVILFTTEPPWLAELPTALDDMPH
ncbi:GNAT family N-acetyltransferase [Streptomyces tailanensis]|uniref:GNAT family N-acetyltransferase n=1 Tax=Streptomyces tailanensis TaxID=2569858 RepID=UPI00155A7297|nr:GNAT family N-acetyltransferase [Streptomyces tailanensis]